MRYRRGRRVRQLALVMVAAPTAAWARSARRPQIEAANRPPWAARPSPQPAPGPPSPAGPLVGRAGPAKLSVGVDQQEANPPARVDSRRCRHLRFGRSLRGYPAIGSPDYDRARPLACGSE